MTDEKLVQNIAPETTQPNNIDDDSEHALISKIARLPHDIREDLNRRLYDGKTGPEILTWLNELPVVKEILRAHFGGAPINLPNLSKWRAKGYQRWLKKQEPLAAIQELSEDASDLVNAGRGRIASGAATVASGQILEYLRNLPPEKRTPEEFEKVISLLSVLLKAEHGEARLKLAEKRVLQRDEHLLLIRDRDQRDDVAVALRALSDAQAREIHASSHNYAQKIELLGHHMFQKLWLGRYVPEESPALASPEASPLTPIKPD